MERKQEEQARQMKELQGQAERLWCDNDQLRAEIEKSHNLGKDMRDSDFDAQPIARDKGKGPVAPDNVDTLMDDELSLGSFPSLNLLSAKNTQESTSTVSIRSSPGEPAGATHRHVATSAARASYLWCNANVSHTTNGPNSETR